MKMDTAEARIAKQRVSNATLLNTHPNGPEKAAVGTSGAIAYALLDVANAIREQGPDERTQRILRLNDLLIDAIFEKSDQSVIEKIAAEITLEREGLSVDQHNGLFSR